MPGPGPLGLSAGLLVCAALLSIAPAYGYINSGLPAAKHRAWLEDMTGQILATSVGDLSPEMLEAAPQVMSAWADNPFYTDPKVSSADAPTMAVERLMKRLVAEQTATGNADAANTYLNTYAYNALLHGWSRSGEGEYAAQRTEQILIEMQDRYEAGNASVQPNTASFRSVLLAWERAASSAESEHDATNAAQRAQRILEWMISLHEAGANDSAEPSYECFDIVMKAWCQTKHADAPRIVEQLLVRMEQLYREGNAGVQPHTRHYNHVLWAWRRSNQKGAAHRAEEILEHMNKLSSLDESKVRPNFDSYNACLTTWAGSDENCAARKAESLLRKMESAYKDDSNKELEPDAVMYNLVINAWANVASTAKTNGRLPYESARRMLDRQIDLYEQHGATKCRPDAYGYTSVIKACDNMSGKSKRQRDKAFRVAETTFLELCSSEHAAPNHVAYGTMLKACAHLLAPGSKQREQVSRLVFDKACRDGCVGAMVLNRFKEAASSASYKDVMGDIKKNSLPYDWTFRVPKNDQVLHRRKPRKSNATHKLPSRINKKTDLKP